MLCILYNLSNHTFFPSIIKLQINLQLYCVPVGPGCAASRTHTDMLFASRWCDFFHVCGLVTKGQGWKSLQHTHPYYFPHMSHGRVMCAHSGLQAELDVVFTEASWKFWCFNDAILCCCFCCCFLKNKTYPVLQWLYFTGSWITYSIHTSTST